MIAEFCFLGEPIDVRSVLCKSHLCPTELYVSFIFRKNRSLFPMLNLWLVSIDYLSYFFCVVTFSSHDDKIQECIMLGSLRLLLSPWYFLTINWTVLLFSCHLISNDDTLYIVLSTSLVFDGLIILAFTNRTFSNCYSSISKTFTF